MDPSHLGGQHGFGQMAVQVWCRGGKLSVNKALPSMASLGNENKRGLSYGFAPDRH
jgi:hypothetical protein